MGKKKKPFIDKKRAVKFQVVHRDQRDPLQADSDAPERVLHPVEGNPNKNKKDEEKKFGIYFDDDYDYLQHLKPRGEGMLVLADEPKDDALEKQAFKDVAGISLPANVLASEYEEVEGLLEKGVLPRGPQPDWDPDIVEALDDGVDLNDPGNILEDNFMIMANASVDNDCTHFAHYHDDEQLSISDRDFDSDDLDSASVDGDMDFSHEETKSRFTSYSLTSSVIRRTEGLKLLDDCFERIMEEYDEENIGGLEDDDMGGVLSTENPLVNQTIEEFHGQQEKKSYQCNGSEDLSSVPKEGNIAECEYNEKVDFERLEEAEKEKWDCESLLSTYSNLYNHPKVISEPKKVKPIKLTKNLEIPIDVLKKREGVKQMDSADTLVQIMPNLTRSKSETKEEKRLRKLDVKERKRERRAEKKANKIAFKDEHKIQEKVFASQPVKSNLNI